MWERLTRLLARLRRHLHRHNRELAEGRGALRDITNASPEEVAEAQRTARRIAQQWTDEQQDSRRS